MSETTTYTEAITAATEQSLAALQQIQDAGIRALTAASTTLPAPTEFVTASFDAAGKVLEQQRAYALRVAELLSSAP
jgi:uncharacterized membrane protein YgcG